MAFISLLVHKLNWIDTKRSPERKATSCHFHTEVAVFLIKITVLIVSFSQSPENQSTAKLKWGKQNCSPFNPFMLKITIFGIFALKFRYYLEQFQEQEFLKKNCISSHCYRPKTRTLGSEGLNPHFCACVALICFWHLHWHLEIGSASSLWFLTSYCCWQYKGCRSFNSLL